MPRRIIVLANHGLYSSLEGLAREKFLSFLGDIFYKLSFEELRGKLPARGIKTRTKASGSWRMTVKVMLTADEIIVTVTDFDGHDDDDTDGEDGDGDGDNLQDVCEYKFKRERGHWRLIRVSGTPLPTPGPSNSHRASSAIELSHAIAATGKRICVHVGSRLDHLMAATGSYLRRSRPLATSAIDFADNYFKTLTTSLCVDETAATQLQNLDNIKGSSPGTNYIEILWVHRITIALILANNSIGRRHPQLTGSMIEKANRAIQKLISCDHQILLALSIGRVPPGRIEAILMETLRRSPEKARRLLVYLADKGATNKDGPELSASIKDDWNALIREPIIINCNSRQISKSMKSHYKTKQISRSEHSPLLSKKDAHRVEQTDNHDVGRL